MSKAKTKPGEVQVGKEYTDARKRSQHFYTKPVESSAGRIVFYFHNTGDYLKGRLFGTGNKGYRFYSTKTYALHVSEGCQDGENFVVTADAKRIEEIVAYKDLRRIIEQNDLMGSVVRIVNAGRVGTMGGHFRLVWEVYKETGTAKKSELRQTATPVRKRKKKARAKEQPAEGLDW